MKDKQEIKVDDSGFAIPDGQIADDKKPENIPEGLVKMNDSGFAIPDEQIADVKIPENILEELVNMNDSGFAIPDAKIPGMEKEKVHDNQIVDDKNPEKDQEDKEINDSEFAVPDGNVSISTTDPSPPTSSNPDGEKGTSLIF